MYVKVSALFLQTRGLFDFHTEGLQLVISFFKKNIKNYEANVNGIPSKAQFHMHNFESKNLKLKWALKLTSVCPDKMLKNEIKKIIPILLFFFVVVVPVTLVIIAPVKMRCSVNGLGVCLALCHFTR